MVYDSGAVSGCVFCGIVRGEVSAHKIWEDSQYLAVLDIFPIRRGQVVLMTKKHMNSYLFSLSDEEVSGICLAAKKVASLLDRKLGAMRTLLVAEGLGVNHAHLKLYPVADAEREGALLGLGERADERVLTRLAELIREGGMK